MKKPQRFDQLTQLTGFSNTILTMALIAISAVGIYYGVSAYVYQGTQDRFALQLEQNVVSNISYVESQILNNATALQNNLNMEVSTINTNIAELNEVLNMTSGSGMTLTGRITTLEDVTIRQINTVGPDPGNNNTVNLEGGKGIDVTDDVGTFTVTMENSGVVTINGVPSSLSMRDLQLLGTGMIDIVNDINASSVTVDGAPIVLTLTNLQMEDSMQSMLISSLQSTVNSLQMQLDAVEMAGQMVAEMLNGTQIDVNMTIMELIDKTMMNEARVLQLEEQIANLTTLSLPTGTLVPWTGTSATIPDGYLLADGTEYSESTYMDLFLVIGTMYCDPPCAMGMFAVPDMRGQVPLGIASTGTFFVPPGTKLGSAQMTLTEAQLPSHSHGGTTDLGNLGAKTAFSENPGPCPSITQGWSGGCPGVVVGAYEPSFSNHVHTFTTDTVGSNVPFFVVQPSMAVHFMIKT